MDELHDMSKQIADKHTKAKNLIAKSSIQIDNTIDEVWKALVNPEIVEKYMLGSQQLSDWRKGSSIVWKKDFNGKKSEDKGRILEITPQKSLKYTHYSPASGRPDAPENYQTVWVTLKENRKGKGNDRAHMGLLPAGAQDHHGQKVSSINRNGLCPFF